MRKLLLHAAAMLALGWGIASAQTTLRIGLAEDPDVLDPTLARTFVGRIVFASLCDKLFDIDENLKIVPQLATGYEWSADNKELTIKLRPGVKFHDGEPMDAEAVRFSLDRHKNMQGSTRRGELAPVTEIKVVDPLTVKMTVGAPFSPLVAQLTDRSGMIVSPKAAQAAGTGFGNKPVCAGPYKFVERVAQDRIVVERFAEYWNKDAVFFDRIVYLPIVDSTVRLANLRSGQLDFIERLAASDAASVRADNRLKFARVVEIGYQGITINTGKSDTGRNSALGKDPRVREAFELSLDRDAIVQVVMEGEAQPGNQYVSSSNPYYGKNSPLPKRDVNRAKALLREAGITNPSFTMMTATTTEAQKISQVVQAMVKETGFDMKIQSTEFATSLDLADKGQFESMILAWSGRADPDGNTQQFLQCNAPQNYSGYCVPEVDKLINDARTTQDPAARAKLYEQLAILVNKDRPIVYLFHRNWLWAYSNKLAGLRTVPDGLVRVQGLKFN